MGNISPSPYQGFGKDELLDFRRNPPIFPGIGEKKLWDESPGRLDFNVGRQANGFHDHWKISPGFDAFGKQPGRMQGEASREEILILTYPLTMQDLIIMFL